jgi:hypothetical protein
MSVFAEPISPELILISPPEVARLARAQLDARPVAAPGALELLAVYAFCLLITLGPLVFIVLATPNGVG